MPIKEYDDWFKNAFALRWPELQPHWKHIFVLFWLFFSRYAQANVSGAGFARSLFHYAWGGVCALLAGVLAGTVLFDEPSVFLWPATGFGLFVTGDRVWDLVSKRKEASWLRLIVVLLCLGATGVLGYFALYPPPEMTTWAWDLSGAYRSPGLTALAAAVALIAILLFVFGLPGSRASAGTFVERWQNDPGRRVGRDMLLTFGGAAIILGVAPWLNPAVDPIDPVRVGGVAANIFEECAKVEDQRTCINMVRIEGTNAETGPFMTANEDGEPGPKVQVKTFWLSQTEVTNEQFEVFAREKKRTPSSTICDWRNLRKTGLEQHPATCISWADAIAYVRWLSQKSGRTYRLATGAEWQFAASEGLVFALPWGDDEAAACSYGNFFGCSKNERGTARVGSYPANSKLLSDMFGNVWEWTEDCPTSAEVGNMSLFDRLTQSCVRAARGGSWIDDPRGARSALRSRLWSADVKYVGFRLARTELGPAS